MIGIREPQFAPLTQVFLEELVLQDHFYWHLESMLDLSLYESS